MSDTDNLKLKQTDLKNISFKDLSIIKNIIFWLDAIPDDKKHKNAIFPRSGFNPYTLKSRRRRPRYWTSFLFIIVL